MPRASEREEEKKKRGAVGSAARTGLEQTHLADPNIDASTQARALPANLRPPEKTGCKVTLEPVFITQKYPASQRARRLAGASLTLNVLEEGLSERLKHLLFMVKSTSKL